MRTVGTQAIGIRMPIIHEGDDLVSIVVDNILNHCKQTNAPLKDRDIIGVTEAIVARAQGNYATFAQISKAVRNKIPSGAVGVVFPILSRNRFSALPGIAAGVDKLYIQLSYPSDEVGNHLVTIEKMYEAGVNPYTNTFDEAGFRKVFGDIKHEFTGIDYIELYRILGNNAEIILANDPCEILKYTKNIIAADIHTREQTKRRLRENGAEIVIGFDDILTESIDGSGYNNQYGILGHNVSSEGRVKLFPHSCEKFVESVHKKIFEKTGVSVEVLVYGDGAFKDPVGKIWELADPVVGVAFTKGLNGLPNELKLKYIADNKIDNKRGEEAREAIINQIREKDAILVGKDETLGTTPRHYSDLIGSLCDLVSGSGDKGTPVVLVTGYFDNYASE